MVLPELPEDRQVERAIIEQPPDRTLYIQRRRIFSLLGHGSPS
jgi:hypothetical protein